MIAALHARDLEIRFPSGLAVGPVHLALGPGIHWLQGPNGGGKTTLLRCLCGGLRPDRGTVSVCGRDPLRDPGARALVALAPAEPEVPEFLRVAEAWRHAAALRRAPAWDGGPLAEALGLPPGLLLAHASSGQRRKAELLAALAGDPPVLLLDEPLAGLDVVAVALLGRWLEAWRGARVVLVTSHEPLPVTPDSTATLEPGRPLAWAPPPGSPLRP